MDDDTVKEMITSGITAVQRYINLYINDTRTREKILYEVLDPAYNTRVDNSDIAMLILNEQRIDPSRYNNDAIILASLHGYKDVVEFLLKDPRVSPEARNNQALLGAVNRGHTDIVDLLLKDPRVNPGDVNNRALSRAVSQGYSNIVELLLKCPSNRGVNPSVSNNYPIMYATNRGYLRIVELLLADPRVDPRANENQPIIYAAENGHVAIVKLLLKDSRVDPSAQDNQAIIVAVRNNHKEIVELLLNDSRDSRNSPIDPSLQDNILITIATFRGHKEIINLLLKDSRVDPCARNNLPIVNASFRGDVEMVELLLKYPKVDPSVQKNITIINMALYGHEDLVKRLSTYPNVDLSDQNNQALINATLRNHENVVKFILTHPNPRIDPSAQDNQAIINAASKGNKNIIELLLKDLSVDPGAQNNRVLTLALENNYIDIVELLLKDVRVDINAISVDANTNQTIIDLIDRRKELDSYFGLVTVDNYYQNKPFDLLKIILTLVPKGYNYKSVSNRINYMFNCLDESKFNAVIKSDITDEELSTILSCVKKIRFNIPTHTGVLKFPGSGAGSVRQRNLLLVFEKLIDNEFLFNKIMDDEYFLPLFTKINIGNANILDVYRKYKLELPLEREYQLGDIIGTRNMYKLYQYILKGNYLPYVKHGATKVWLELTPDERSFIETFMFPVDYHKDYMNTLSVKDKRYWNDYVYVPTYSDLNKNLRESNPLTPDMINWYNSLNTSIIAAPVTNKRCVLYRGIEAEEFNPVVSGAPSDLDSNTSMDIIVWNAFSSCSLVREIADGFQGRSPCCLFVIIVPAGAVLFDITSIKNSEFEIVLPPGSIMKYLGVNAGNTSGTGECHILKYLGYETDEGPYYFESEDERNKTLEEEMSRYATD